MLSKSVARCATELRLLPADAATGPDNGLFLARRRSSVSLLDLGGERAGESICLPRSASFLAEEVSDHTMCAS